MLTRRSLLLLLLLAAGSISNIRQAQIRAAASKRSKGLEQFHDALLAIQTSNEQH